MKWTLKYKPRLYRTSYISKYLLRSLGLRYIRVLLYLSYASVMPWFDDVQLRTSRAGQGLHLCRHGNSQTYADWAETVVSRSPPRLFWRWQCLPLCIVEMAHPISYQTHTEYNRNKISLTISNHKMKYLLIAYLVRCEKYLFNNNTSCSS